MTAPYPHLLSPLTIGRYTLKNRVLMGSMHSRLETLDRPIEREAAFYAERAKGGVAMVITAGIAPNVEGSRKARMCLTPPDRWRTIG